MSDLNCVTLEASLLFSTTGSHGGFVFLTSRPSSVYLCELGPFSVWYSYVYGGSGLLVYICLSLWPNECVWDCLVWTSNETMFKKKKKVCCSLDDIPLGFCFHVFHTGYQLLEDLSCMVSTYDAYWWRMEGGDKAEPAAGRSCEKSEQVCRDARRD